MCAVMFRRQMFSLVDGITSTEECQGSFLKERNAQYCISVLSEADFL